MGTFIEDNCEFVEWSRPLIENCSDFSCTHDKDIENFFKNDFENYNNQLLGKSYGFVKANTSLELANGYTTNGTNIQLYKSNNSDAQFWKLKDDGNGNISIVSKKANICVTVANSSTANKTNIQANTCNNQNNQKFNFFC